MSSSSQQKHHFTSLQKDQLERSTRIISSEVAKGVRGLLREAASGTIAEKERREVPKSIKQMVDVIRNVAALVDSLHELSTSKFVLSIGLLSVVKEAEQMVTSCAKLDSLSQLEPAFVRSIVARLDKSAETLEKSEEVLELLDNVDKVEVGIRNTGLNWGEFARLAGIPADKSKLVAILKEDTPQKESESLPTPSDEAAPVNWEIDFSAIESPDRPKHKKIEEAVNAAIESRSENKWEKLEDEAREGLSSSSGP